MTRTQEAAYGGVFDPQVRQNARRKVYESIDQLWACFRDLNVKNNATPEERIEELARFANALSMLTQHIQPLNFDPPAAQERTEPAPQTQATKNDDLAPVKAMFVLLTPKQHAVIQMVLAGATNVEIAKRLGWSDSTAKGAVHNLARKFLKDTGTQRMDRVGLDQAVRPVFDAMSDDEYEHVAGIPKDWDKNWSEDDKSRRPALYEKRH